VKRFLCMLILLGVGIVLPAHAASFVVNDLGDASDANPGNGACATAGAVCTLRAAIQEANAFPGSDQITFDAAGTIIVPFASDLPVITETLVIDGTTAPGYAGAPVVVLEGAGGLGGIALYAGAAAPGSTIAGLKIHGFVNYGIRIDASSFTIRNNYLGPVGGGMANRIGASIAISSFGGTVGGADGAGNVISGNSQVGLEIAGSSHTVSDNYVGTNAAGTAALPNGTYGIGVLNADGISIVGTSAADRNVISGNGGSGIGLSGVQNVTVYGNFIGVDATGTVDLGNGVHGVEVSGVAATTIGDAALPNVIAGNGQSGVIVVGSNPVIAGNVIGTDLSGTIAIPNSVGVTAQAGVLPGPVVVGTLSAGNTIAFNTQQGVVISGTGALVLNNRIESNGAPGVYVTNAATEVDIGGPVVGQGNLISLNGGDGVLIDGGSANVRLYGNTIGLDATRSADRGNSGNGVSATNATAVTIGGAGEGRRNFIAGNGANGVAISAGFDHSVENNLIGTDGAGAAAIANAFDGIVTSSTDGLVVTYNVISGNGDNGVEVSANADGTTITNNLIGVGADFGPAIPNGADGVSIRDGALNTTIGTPALPNTIAHNNGAGIAAEAGALLNNVWAANSIHDNGGLGIDLAAGAANDGVTPNDASDADAGPNALLNFPLITSVTSDVVSSTILGTIHTSPNTAITLHFYRTPAADPSGHGEGNVYIGALNTNTDAAGNAPFEFIGSSLPLGQLVTATATSTQGTSEFSASLPIVSPTPQIAFSLATYSANENGVTATITVVRTGDLSGTSTVDSIVSDGTAANGSDYTATTGALTFVPGDAEETFTVAIINDALDEPDETVNLELGNVTGAILVSPDTATLTIVDDDAAAPAVADVPALSGWMLALLAMALVTVAFRNWG